MGLVAGTISVAVAGLIWGGEGVKGALRLALLALAIQLVAARLARRLGRPATPDNLKVYVIGMALRISGVALIGVMVTIDRAGYPPGPAALGYLGTLLPLMWLETRLT